LSLKDYIWDWDHIGLCNVLRTSNIVSHDKSEASCAQMKGFRWATALQLPCRPLAKTPKESLQAAREGDAWTQKYLWSQRHEPEAMGESVSGTSAILLHSSTHAW
jgi:hypothetical protein